MEQLNELKNESNNISNEKNDLKKNYPNEFEKIESINKIQTQTQTQTQTEQIKPQFDFYKDFEMRELLEKNTESNLNNESKEIDIEMMLNSFPIINDNLRANIKLSVEIYKKINNFDINYVHDVINNNNST